MAAPDVAPTPHRTGCVACGAPLAYLGRAQPMRCESCGVVRPSDVRCEAGHFFCDACHAPDAPGVIEQVCLEATEKDPVAIATRAMRNPALKMHGPEHHFLAPGALIAAWCNVTGAPRERRVQLLAEGRRRASQVPGGSCGSWGACGAAVGTGIFVSLVTGATPRARREWALAHAMTAQSLGLLAEQGGPRCCKRSTWLSLLSAARFARRELGVALPARGPRCEFSPMNPDCHREACPFHPRTEPPRARLAGA